MTNSTIHICNAISKQLYVSPHAKGHCTMHACPLCKCLSWQPIVECKLFLNVYFFLNVGYENAASYIFYKASS